MMRTQEGKNMNKLMIIGNLVRDPEKRTTTAGVNVTSFTVAVNKPKKDGQDQGADFFRVTAWRGLADICAKYLSKGKKVAVVGSVSLHTYQSNGETKASMEVNADDVEFLSPRGEMTPVNDPDDPFGGLN
jgi:single-strand DNA-binding protein